MQDLAILGTAGNSLEILDSVLAQAQSGTAPRYRVVGFLDDNPTVQGSVIHGVPVLGGLGKARELDGVAFVNGIGSTNTYRKKAAILDALGVPDDRFATVIHPSAVVSTFAVIGAGSVILQNVVVSSRAVIGRHVQVLPLSVVSHDAEVGDYATIAGGVSISGFVKIGRSSYIGTHAAIRGGVSIGEGALVGMGSVVLRDVAENAMVAGVPAMELPRKS